MQLKISKIPVFLMQYIIGFHTILSMGHNKHTSYEEWLELKDKKIRILDYNWP